MAGKCCVQTISQTVQSQRVEQCAKHRRHLSKKSIHLKACRIQRERTTEGPVLLRLSNSSCTVFSSAYKTTRFSNSAIYNAQVKLSCCVVLSCVWHRTM